VRILAHRGSVGPDRIENTGPALRAALDEGADGAALDLRLTADGVPLARMDRLTAAAQGRALVLELKASTTPRGRVAAAVVDELLLLDATGTSLDLTLASCDAALIRLARIALPTGLGVRTALIGRPACPARVLLRRARAGGHDQIQPYISDLFAEPALVGWASAAGITVVPWTVNSRRAVRRCAELGVDAVITDHPRRARSALALQAAAA
jgi:glycerophosphoryl diester phosphodiesterase